MKLKLLSLEGTSKKDIELPAQFNESVRPDLIRKVVRILQSRKRQQYGANPEAGQRHSAFLSKRRHKYRGTYGIGQSRTPRKVMSRRGTRLNYTGAVAPQTVGGRRAHPPKAEKILALKINKKERSLKEHAYITVGWSMYAGWITAATFVNVTTAVVSSGFDPAPLGEANWTIIVLLIALVIYLMVLITRNDFIFASVGLWAVIGIIIERTSPAFTPQPEIVPTK